jgi:hypothetical protein
VGVTALVMTTVAKICLESMEETRRLAILMGSGVLSRAEANSTSATAQKVVSAMQQRNREEESLALTRFNFAP